MNNLKETLLQTYPYRVELHAHTNPVSGCSEIPPKELVQRYIALGAHGVVITNHATPNQKATPQKEWLEWYTQDYMDTKAAGDKAGLQVYLGMEIRFPDSNNDYLVYGVDEETVAEAWDYLDKDLHQFYRRFHADDRVIVQAHPCRDGMAEVNPAYLDGVEVFNMHPGHNSRVAMAAKHPLAAEGIVTGGTDFHHRGHEGRLFAAFKELPEDSFALARALKSGDYILVMENAVILP